MEQLADAGDGNYAYIDSLREARKVLVDQLSSTLKVVARDVKLQVEFNPAQVSEYRLLGYENRALKREDFSNDKVDAGEIGAGHTVTALYEIVPAGGRAGWSRCATSRRRRPMANPPSWPGCASLQAPGSEQSKLLERPIAAAEVPAIAGASEDLRFAAAVAAFAQQLRAGSTPAASVSTTPWRWPVVPVATIVSACAANSCNWSNSHKACKIQLLHRHGSSDLSEPITDDDAALLRRCRDAEAFGVLYARHRLGSTVFSAGCAATPAWPRRSSRKPG